MKKNINKPYSPQQFKQSTKQTSIHISNNFGIKLDSQCQNLNKLTNKNIPYEQNLNQFLEKLGNLKHDPFLLGTFKDEFNQQIENVINLTDVLSKLKTSLKKLNRQKKPKKNWLKDDLIIFLWIIEKYSILYDKKVEQYTESDWQYIANILPGKDSIQCMFKWLGLNKNSQQEKYNWTQYQDSLLKSLVQQSHDNHWYRISKELYLKNPGFKVFRNPKQCRERWACFVNPNIIKGPWTEEQDLILLNNFILIQKKWSRMTKFLNGRTQNAIKNRFNLLMNKGKANTLSSQIEFAKQCIQNIELNLFVKTSDETPTNLVFSDFTNFKQNQNQFIKNEQIIEQDLSEREQQNEQSELCNESENQNNMSNCKQFQEISEQSSISQERRNTKFIKIKKMSIQQIIGKGISIFPAEHDQINQQLIYKQIKPSLKKQINQMDQNQSHLIDLSCSFSSQQITSLDEAKNQFWVN